MEKREIPLKNYMILLAIVIVTILLCLYIAQWYKKAEENNIEEGILAKNLPQVTLEEFENYVLENPNTILYISVSTDESTKRFEKNIDDFMREENIQNHFIYIDASKVEQNKLEEILKSKSKDLKNTYPIIPNMYVFKEGKIEDILYTEKPTLHAKEAIRFMKKQDIIK